MASEQSRKGEKHETSVSLRLDYNCSGSFDVDSENWGDASHLCFSKIPFLSHLPPLPAICRMIHFW